MLQHLTNDMLGHFQGSPTKIHLEGLLQMPKPSHWIFSGFKGNGICI